MSSPLPEPVPEPGVVRAYRLRAAQGDEGHPYAALLGIPGLDTPGLLGRVRAGLNYSAVEHLEEATSLSQREMSETLQIPARTLNRRRREGRLHADESDRLLRLARVFSRTLDLFEGDTAAARAWLRTPQPGLNGAWPLQYAATEIGSRELERLIARLEHGIVA